ncbi:MAG: GNAT family N-acetyltransferase [candidate division WOR-3 bacterium]
MPTHGMSLGDYQVFKVRPLNNSDARAIGLLTHQIYAEIGQRPAESIEKIERLFNVDWLQNGAGLVLEKSGKIIGYGWARVSVWHQKDIVNMGLYLGSEARGRDCYHLLTDELFTIAQTLAKKFRVNEAMIFYRSTDNIHPPILMELGFSLHPISMLGFQHNLESLPEYQPISGITITPIDLKRERQELSALAQQVFDDIPNQGEPVSDVYLDWETSDSRFQPEQFLFARAGNKPIGYLLIFRDDRNQELIYEIAEFGVLPQWRHQGIGWALLVYALQWIKNQGAKFALVASFSSNPVLSLYWRLGFRPDPSRTYNFYFKSL